MPALKVRPSSVRISKDASERLNSLVKTTGRSKVELLDVAVRKLEDDLFWNAFNEGYATSGGAIRGELQGTEGSLLDGLQEMPI